MADRAPMHARVAAAAALCIALVLLWTGACAAMPHGESTDHIVRVALARSLPSAKVSATGSWRIYDGGGRSVLVVGRPSDTWAIERRGVFMRAVRGDDDATGYRSGPFIVRPIDENAFLSYGGRRYRGELWVSAADDGLTIVNRLPVDAYLRGVIPLELGDVPESDVEALKAQAIAARSYTYAAMSENVRRGYDLVAGVSDQVYGGASAEKPLGNRAIDDTRDLVLTYGGHVVSAPYHSTCGGTTAASSEVWRSPDVPYLRPVSDRIPGTSRSYCDIAPRFSWTRTYTRAQLASTLEKYLRDFATVQGRIGVVQRVALDGHTASGRAQALVITTDRATYRLRGNDTRFVLRNASGEILNSTYFTVSTVTGGDGALESLTLSGNGYGHGVGMCQWGAIGRARAGQRFGEILSTYYPGTRVSPVP